VSPPVDLNRNRKVVAALQTLGPKPPRVIAGQTN
jgi:hypothetical protein